MSRPIWDSRTSRLTSASLACGWAWACTNILIQAPEIRHALTRVLGADFGFLLFILGYPIKFHLLYVVLSKVLTKKTEVRPRVRKVSLVAFWACTLSWASLSNAWRVIPVNLRSHHVVIIADSLILMLFILFILINKKTFIKI